MARHPTIDQLERYSLGRLTGPELALVEEHLLLCERCRARLTEIDAFVRATRAAARQLRETPLDILHHTADGPVRLLVEKTGQGEWKATFAGQELEGMGRFETIAEANEYLLESFRLMFPEHKCGERCSARTRPDSTRKPS